MPLAHSGLLAGVAAFFLWGLLPLYWKELHTIPALETVAHRILWSALLLLPLLCLSHPRQAIRRAIHSSAVRWRVLYCALLIGTNWGIFVWCINTDRVIEASLGYFINPLLSVLLGALILHEHLSRLQTIAIGIATAGVLWSVLMLGHMPWMALGLALTFTLYGFFRKTIALDPLPSLMLESLLLLPVAVGYLYSLHSTGQGHFTTLNSTKQILLMGTGVITLVPMWLFAYAARHLRLSTLGLLQYLSPTSTFVLGVVVFAEPLSASSLVTFVCIWVALALYSYGLLRPTAQ